MKKLLIAVCIFTALTFLALPMGNEAQGQTTDWRDDIAQFLGQYLKVKYKGFEKNDAAWVKVDAKRVTPSKIFGEMVIESASGDKISIAVTNPCTTVCVRGACWEKCTP